ncbi:sulfotransferase family protein [Novosphingobium sp. JCM 18896]|uniref:sulfotransferase family protein n=1 Tax=Novosphingobium sp. JCM 18896 TaxID=2989731 RepID=UPI0022213D8B|nr:sulfotransferase [Novosphingobium sp. JCM 18896]MCW1429521.1 sulfotransferase [Novosphingobium sp. JCM 18896]
MAMKTFKQLLEAARTATALEDFGEETFREGLERLLASLDGEARLNLQGEMLIEHQIVDLLSRRLEVEHWYAMHPEIDDQEIVAPLIGLGLPRTGSTALGCLLAEDPAVRSLRAWEANAPCPPPEAASEHSDPRIEEQRVRSAQIDAIAPRLKMMIPVSPTAPTECQQFMGFDFKSQIFQASARIPSYFAWLNHDADLVPTYRYVKRVLKLLQWRCPPHRWRLKNPAHMLFIDALDTVFPDARYWMTHRDIAKVIPSVVDLYRELSRAYTDEPDGGWIVAANVEWTSTGLERVRAFRERGHDRRFFDVDFLEVQTAPMDVMERLYAFLGEEFTIEARRRMLAWREQEPVNKHGRHSYDPASLGVDLAAVSARFAFYDHEAGRR